MSPPKTKGDQVTVLTKEQVGKWLRGYSVTDVELVDSHNELLDRAEAAEASVAVLREALEDYGEHGRGCARARFEAGRPTESGGYESCYAGRWYETRPNDRTPTCTCGLAAALASTAPGEKEVT